MTRSETPRTYKKKTADTGFFQATAGGRLLSVDGKRLFRSRLAPSQNLQSIGCTDEALVVP